MKESLSKSKGFKRTLEIIPGFVAWSILILPFVLAPTFPVAVAYFILAFNLYWFLKSINLMRYMVGGFRRLWRNMKIDWLERCKEACDNPKAYQKLLLARYEKTGESLDRMDYLELANVEGKWDAIKDWKDVYQAVFITNCFESFEITEPTYDAIFESNFPNNRIIVVSCGEKRDEAGFLAVKKQLEAKYRGKFFDIQFFIHKDMPGDVIGKGPNLSSAGHKFWAYMQKSHPEISPENVLVTTLDADHVVHREYFSYLTYKYIIDVNRARKTYQPIPLLFNNIWDAPSASRVLAVASSFWQIIESMRPYRLRTFASHTQSLSTLLVTDFWSTKTTVEDGHQYWRTYFAFNGEHEMVPLFMPVYHDTVLAESVWETMKNQYKQRRRWAWGVSDFPFVIINYLKHPEIPLGEKLIQTTRMFTGNISWSTASFLLAFAWIPLAFNSSFQDTVLAHNVSTFSSNMLTLAWVAVIASVWIYLVLLPPLPKYHSKARYVGMVAQWLIAPFVAIFFSSLPALESQTRLMLGRYMDVFWVTPKVKTVSKFQKNATK